MCIWEVLLKIHVVLWFELWNLILSSFGLSLVGISSWFWFNCRLDQSEQSLDWAFKSGLILDRACNKNISTSSILVRIKRDIYEQIQYLNVTVFQSGFHGREQVQNPNVGDGPSAMTKSRFRTKIIKLDMDHVNIGRTWTVLSPRCPGSKLKKVIFIFSSSSSKEMRIMLRHLFRLIQLA